MGGEIQKIITVGIGSCTILGTLLHNGHPYHGIPLRVNYGALDRMLLRECCESRDKQHEHSKILSHVCVIISFVLSVSPGHFQETSQSYKFRLSDVRIIGVKWTIWMLITSINLKYNILKTAKTRIKWMKTNIFPLERSLVSDVVAKILSKFATLSIKHAHM